MGISPVGSVDPDRGRGYSTCIHHSACIEVQQPYGGDIKVSYRCRRYRSVALRGEPGVSFSQGSQAPQMDLFVNQAGDAAAVHSSPRVEIELRPVVRPPQRYGN